MKGQGGLIGAVLGLLGFLLMLAAMATESTDAGDRPSVYNQGLLGHSDWRQLLEQTGQRVSVSRQRDTGRRLGPNALHIVAEPERGHLPDSFPDAPRTVLVLPKWRLQVSTASPSFGKVTSPVDDAAHDWIRGRLELPESLAPPQGRDPTERALRLHAQGGSDHDVAIIEPIAATTSWFDRRQELLETGDGQVFAFTVAVGDREVTVVTDPDLVNNHGLRRADNGAAMLALMDAIADGQDVEFVFDEAVHGFVGPPGILAALVAPPLCWFSGYLLLAGGVVAWVLGRGFGPQSAPPETLTGDSASLVLSAANLLHATGQPESTLRRYRQARERAVAQAFHIRAESADDLRAALRRLGRSRKHPFPDPAPTASIHDAQAVDRWCRDILDGHPSAR